MAKLANLDLLGGLFQKCTVLTDSSNFFTLFFACVVGYTNKGKINKPHKCNRYNTNKNYVWYSEQIDDIMSCLGIWAVKANTLGFKIPCDLGQES